MLLLTFVTTDKSKSLSGLSDTTADALLKREGKKAEGNSIRHPSDATFLLEKGGFAAGKDGEVLLSHLHVSMTLLSQ